MTVLALSTLGLSGSGILSADPVFIGTLIMTVSSLIGIIGMGCTLQNLISINYSN